MVNITQLLIRNKSLWNNIFAMLKEEKNVYAFSRCSKNIPEDKNNESYIYVK